MGLPADGETEDGQFICRDQIHRLLENDIVLLIIYTSCCIWCSAAALGWLREQMLHVDKVYVVFCPDRYVIRCNPTVMGSFCFLLIPFCLN